MVTVADNRAIQQNMSVYLSDIMRYNDDIIVLIAWNSRDILINYL